ncbi:hypothetical protein DPEC_G00218820 [Dallia pectoralis]|uniref:Uncharacterized protein n=1 Tax=Dallia pectoralis TaxID=75939 RepID=A0ACC2G2W7_DALPE|nr:hypothetical protein DPEC_G00218820 [Dallia pectoralis]
MGTSNGAWGLFCRFNGKGAAASRVVGRLAPGGLVQMVESVAGPPQHRVSTAQGEGRPAREDGGQVKSCLNDGHSGVAEKKKGDVFAICLTGPARLEAPDWTS